LFVQNSKNKTKKTQKKKKTGFYFCSSDGIKVGYARQANMKTGLVGGEGWFQTKLSGTGWAVINIPVPPAEVQKFELKNDTLQVDGTFAILRRGDIKFTVQRSAKGFINTMASGEGLLQTFVGTGEVWICPTLQSYAPFSPFGAYSSPSV